MPDRSGESAGLWLALAVLLLAVVTLAYGQSREEPRVVAEESPEPVSPGPDPVPSFLGVVIEPVSPAAPSPSPSPSPPPPPPPPAISGDDLAAYAAELPPDAIEIAAVGDVNLGGTLGRVIAERGPEYPWGKVSALLSQADIAFANFESTASRRGSPAPKQFTFRSEPGSLLSMRDSGIDVASVANNHILDYGTDALLDTVGNLRDLGIQTTGAGANEAEAWAPAVLESGGVRFSFIAATRVLPTGWAATPDRPGVASAYQQSRLLDAVASAKAQGSVVVVSVHWGVETNVSPEPYQVDLAHRLVDAGASIVLGHHPHVLQPVERYRGAVIAYSLGNFVFTAPSLEQTSMILRIGWRSVGEPVVVRQPVRIVGGQPRPD